MSVFIMQVASVGAGAILREVDRMTVKHGLVAPLGSYSALGVVGLTLLGGVGFLSRHYGLTADNVIEFGKCLRIWYNLVLRQNPF